MHGAWGMRLRGAVSGTLTLGANTRITGMTFSIAIVAEWRPPSTLLRPPAPVRSAGFVTALCTHRTHLEPDRAASLLHRFHSIFDLEESPLRAPGGDIGIILRSRTVGASRHYARESFGCQSQLANVESSHVSYRPDS